MLARYIAAVRNQPAWSHVITVAMLLTLAVLIARDTDTVSGSFWDNATYLVPIAGLALAGVVFIAGEMRGGKD